MDTQSYVVDLNGLTEDLRRGVEYASRAGLLRGAAVLDAISAAEKTIKNDQRPDLHAVTLALNEVAQVIAPITVADLRFRRDPTSLDNQKRAKILQLSLTIFSLAVMVLIGLFMNGLRIEQGSIAELNEINRVQPELKLTALRKMAEKDEPTSQRSPLFDEYHQKIEELRQINNGMLLTFKRACDAAHDSLFPFGNYFIKAHDTKNAGEQGCQQSSAAGTEEPSIPMKSDPSTPPNINAFEITSDLRRSGDTAATDASANSQYINGASQMTSFSSATDAQLSSAEVPNLCDQDQDGGMQLPKEAAGFPKWMKTVLADTLSDFCFQLKVLSPDGRGTLLNVSMAQLQAIPEIKDKIALRTTWFLPFFYGLLGAAIFMIRDVASIRTPAMEGFPILMRVSLGGVAGIVIGWFTVAPSNLETVSSISVPFALAFVTGYGIDVLFTMLDRLNRALGAHPKAVGA